MPLKAWSCTSPSKEMNMPKNPPVQPSWLPAPIANLDPKLSVGSAGNPVVHSEKLQISPTFNFEGKSLALEATADFQLIALNDEKDEDGDEVFGASTAKVPRFLIYDPSKAWLKYRAEGNLRAAAGLPLSSAKLKIDGGITVIIAEYRQHSRAKTVLNAVTSDAPPRTLFSAADVQGMTSGDALLLSFSGTLKSVLTLSWSDAVSRSIGEVSRALSRMIPKTADVAVVAGASASVTATVELKDVFRLIAGRKTNGKIDVSLFKAEKRGGQISTRAGVEVKLDAGDVKTLATSIVGAVLGESMTALRAFLDNAANQWNEAFSDELRRILELVGVEDDPVAGAVKKAKARLDELENEAIGRVTQVLSQKIGLSFHHDYIRTSTEEALIELRITDQAFPQYHPDLIRQNIDNLLIASSAGQPGIELQNYLRQKSIEREQAWGFSLGWGKWSISDKDKLDSKFVKRQNANGEWQVAFLGTRAFQTRESWSGVSRHSVDLKADMEAWATAPNTTHFDFGLAFVTEWEGQKATSRLAEFIDQAVMYGILAADSDEIWETLARTDAKATKATISVTFGEGALISILPKVKSDDHARIARALAAGLPYHSNFKGRRTQAARVAIYEPLWLEYLQAKKLASPRKAAASMAMKYGDGGLSNWEASNLQALATFESQLLGQKALARIAEFTTAAERLDQAIGGATAYEAIDRRIFSVMEGFWSQPLYFRACLDWLLSLGDEYHSRDGIDRSLTIELSDGEKLTFTATR